MGRLTGACVAASPPWYARRSEPLDRLERSSPGYGPGTSPSTLERQCTAAVPLDDRRLADVRHAICQRALLSQPIVRRYPVFRRGAGCARSPPLQGSESNRRGPTHEAGLGASTRPAKHSIESTRRESNPPRRLGRPVPHSDRPRVHCESGPARHSAHHRTAGLVHSEEVEAGGLAPSSRATPLRHWARGQESNLATSGFHDNPLQSALTDRARLPKRDQSGAPH